MSGAPNVMEFLKFTKYVLGLYAGMILRNTREKVDDKKILKYRKKFRPVFLEMI